MSYLRAFGSLCAGRGLSATRARCAGAAWRAVPYHAHAAYAVPHLVRTLATEVGFLDRAEVSQRVLEVVRKFEKVQPEKVTETSHFVNDLGLDSLDAVELVMALEDEFAIEIADSDAEKILSCEDAVSFLSSNVNAK